MVETTFIFDPKQEYASVRCVNQVRADTDLIALAFKAKEEAVNLLLVEPDCADGLRSAGSGGGQGEDVEQVGCAAYFTHGSRVKKAA